MSHHAQHLSDQPGSLEPSAFQLQLRRLESLQTLMTQGGAVVCEVAAFLAKAREELSALQREQEGYAEVQQQLLEEKTELTAKLAAVTKVADEATLRSRELEAQLMRLSTEASLREDRIPRAEWQAERKKLEEQLTAAAVKISRLEAALQVERSLASEIPTKVQPDEAVVANYAKEITLLKSRLSALENQLEAERERRTRLMEVVKVHEVTVNGQRQRENV